MKKEEKIEYFLKSSQKKLNEILKQRQFELFIIRNPIASMKVRKAAQKAIQEAEKRFSNQRLHNNQGDAFRHCYRSTLVSKNIGYQLAREITNAYEIKYDNPIKEKEMDLHNNAIGLELGKHSSNEKILANKCFEAIKRKGKWFK